MCGLFGYITKVDKKLSSYDLWQRERILKGLALASEERGEDSTGIATVKNGTVKIYKDILSAQKFVKEKDYLDLVAKKPNIVVGHTRFATTGVVSVENSHPFQKGTIVGSHNGVVSNYLQIDNKVSVDSEVIFKLLDENKTNYEKTFKRLTGMFAVSWLNTTIPNTLFLVRSDNPLNLVYCPSLETYFYASSPTSLRSVVNVFVDDAGEVAELETDKVLMIDPQLKFSYYKVSFSSWYSGYNHDHDDKTLLSSLDKAEIEDIEEQEYIDELVASVVFCEDCKKALEAKKGFWLNIDQEFALCGKCFAQNDTRNGTWKFITHQQYCKSYDAICMKYDLH